MQSLRHLAGGCRTALRIAASSPAITRSSASKLLEVKPLTSTLPSLNPLVPRLFSTTPANNVFYFRDSQHLVLYDKKTGRRGTLPDAEKRFKRLDWGIYIRPRAGARKKHWRKSASRMWQKEQHVFCVRYHVRRFDKMNSPEFKRKRYIPDCMYDKYNKLSYGQNYWLKHKNAENIKIHGNDIHRFNRWKAHVRKHATKFNLPHPVRYEPPGYYGNVFENKGVYREEFVPQDKPAPHFQRALVRSHKLIKDKYLKSVLDLEGYHGKLPVYSTLYKSKFDHH